MAARTRAFGLASVNSVSALSELNGIPGVFRTAVRSLAHARVRPEVSLTRISAPAGLAPYAMCMAAEVGRIHRRALRDDGRMARTAPTAGRFVLLYDPSRPSPWGGPFRVVTWFRAHMDPEIGRDELLTDVSWSWLTEALEANGARYTADGGTASRTTEKGFGSLQETPESVEIEVRASWSPVTGHDPRDWAAAHMEAWADLLCTATGLPPHVEGVTYL